MSKKFQILLRSFFSFAFIVFVIGSSVVVAQTTLTGEWKADARSEKHPEKIQLSFTRRTEKGGTNQHGSSFEYSDLQGLSREQALGSGAVRFSLVREAGTIECEGRFDGAGKGSGTFRFTGSQQYVSAMKSRGFDFEAPDGNGKKPGNLEDRLFSAATINVTTAFADDLLSANFGKLTVDDLFKAAIFKITPQFMSEMKASGFPNLGMEELVKARIFKIDAGFVREVAQMGFDKEPFESLVKMRIFKVTPEFITEVRNEGLSNLDVEDLVKMRIFKIDGAFIRQAKADGVPLEVEKLVQKRIGVWGRD
ncbi:MAG: hypothetical protein M3384_06170 [Acidobacteriota bacterium]|nr:hypothetical protein [Acidobacteriota bacterium]